MPEFPSWRPMPFDLLRKFRVKEWGGPDSAEATEADKREEVASLNDADVVTSQFTDNPGFHMVVLDLDVPAALIPSSTPGHSHLYISTAMTWDTYEALLDALKDAEVLEPGYVGASKARQCTSVRLPWVTKPVETYALEDLF